MHIPPHLVSSLASLLVILKTTVAHHFKLGLPQLAVIGMLTAAGTLHFKELRRRMAVPKSTFTVMVDQLEKRGLVERVRTEEDRRACKISLTDKGERLAREVSRREAATLELALSGLPEDQAEQVLTALDQLARGGVTLATADARSQQDSRRDGRKGPHV